MPRFKYALGAALGLLLLVGVLSLIGPKRALAAIGYTPVRDMDNPARQPFQQAFHFFVNSGFADSPLIIPPNKRLVIEFISATYSLGSTGNLQIGDPNTLKGFITLPAHETSYYGVTGNQQVRFYCEPGTTVPVHVDFTTTSVTGAGVVDFTIVGYYVNLP